MERMARFRRAVKKGASAICCSTIACLPGSFAQTNKGGDFFASLLTLLSLCLVLRGGSAAADEGTAGFFIPSIENQISLAGCARQPDGKIVVAATVAGEQGVRPHRSIWVSRYDESGQPDATFGNHGAVSWRVPDADTSAVALLALADGRIVVGGEVFQHFKAANSDFLAIRLLPDGTLDPSFNRQGWMTEDLTGDHDKVHAIADDRHGGFFLAGGGLRRYMAVSSRYDFAVARVRSDGTLDKRFGQGGKAFVRVGSVSEDMGKAVAVDRNDSVVLAGFSRHGYYPDLTVVRLTPHGKRDLLFATLGKNVFSLSRNGSQANSVLLQDDGKVLVGGDFWTEGSVKESRAIILRLSKSGASDKAFGTEGIAMKGPRGYKSSSIQTLALQTDGRILGAGVVVGHDKQRKIFVTRVLADGRSDPAFGKEGTVVIELKGKSADVKSLISLADGQILLCAQAQAANERYYPPKRTTSVFLRLKPDGGIDPASGPAVTVVNSPVESRE